MELRRRDDWGKGDGTPYAQRDLEWEASLTAEEKEAMDADWEAFLKSVEDTSENT